MACASMCTALVSTKAAMLTSSGQTGKIGLLLMHVKNLTCMLWFSAITFHLIVALIFYYYCLIKVGGHDSWSVQSLFRTITRYLTFTGSADDGKLNK